MRYQTMTVGGDPGSTVLADDDEAAVAVAETMGYEVLDVVDGESGPIVVIAD